METRVQKYRTYRADLTKEGSIHKKEYESLTTTTLPLNEVMSSLGEDKSAQNYYRAKSKLQNLKYILLFLIFVGVVVGVVFLGIYAFRS